VAQGLRLELSGELLRRCGDDRGVGFDGLYSIANSLRRRFRGVIGESEPAWPVEQVAEGGPSEDIRFSLAEVIRRLSSGASAVLT
jgi:hypothetical protein